MTWLPCKTVGYNISWHQLFFSHTSHRTKPIAGYLINAIVLLQPLSDDHKNSFFLFFWARCFENRLLLRCHICCWKVSTQTRTLNGRASRVWRTPLKVRWKTDVFTPQNNSREMALLFERRQVPWRKLNGKAVSEFRSDFYYWELWDNLWLGILALLVLVLVLLLFFKMWVVSFLSY